MLKFDNFQTQCRPPKDMPRGEDKENEPPRGKGSTKGKAGVGTTGSIGRWGKSHGPNCTLGVVPGQGLSEDVQELWRPGEEGHWIHPRLRN